jgi:hypothetical protein
MTSPFLKDSLRLTVDSQTEEQFKIASLPSEDSTPTGNLEKQFTRPH